MNGLAQLINRAFTVAETPRSELAQQFAASLEVADRCQTAAILVTDDGTILHANIEGGALLKDARAIRAQQGKISARRNADANRLLALIRPAGIQGANSNRRDGVMLVHQTNALPVSLLVAPFRVFGYPCDGAIVFVRDPAKASVAHESLQSLYGLTRAEARIADALARGISIEMIAAEQHLSRETVRKQVKGIFAKTGTHRQAECVAQILRGVASMTNLRRGPHMGVDG